jgi:hypothetical protein
MVGYSTDLFFSKKQHKIYPVPQLLYPTYWVKAQTEVQRADRETQRVQELEAQVAIYQQRLGETPPRSS